MRGPDFSKWRQIPLDLEGYDYLRRSPAKVLANRLLLALAVPALTLLCRVLFGLRIDGWENLRPLDGRGAVAVCNHVHWLDCAMAARAVFPRRQYFVTLQSNMEAPLVRRLITLLGGLPVPRERRHLIAFSSAVDEALKGGAIVHIYPEGALDPYCPQLRPFKNGAFSFARDAGVPVLPLCVAYRRPRALWRLKRRPCMTLHILPPVFPDPSAPRGPEILRLRETCRNMMSDCAAARDDGDRSFPSI